MSTIAVKLPTLYQAQLDAFWCGTRFAAIEACTKAGKTVGAIVWQAYKVLRDQLGLNHWWAAPVYSQAAIAWRRARDMFRGLCRPNESDLKLTFDNGSVWWFKSAEKPDNLYGEDVGSCVFDEYTRARYESWVALLSTMTATEAQCRLIGNVRGRGWGFQLARKAEAGERDWSFSRITADDAIAAGVLTKESVESARRNMREDVFRELYYCEASDDGGNPFGLQHIAACCRPYDAGDPVVYGIDLAKSVDWTVVVGLDEDANVSTYDRWQRVPWSETRRRVASIIGDRPALVDATGVGDPIVEQMANDGLSVEPFVFTPKSKQQLMEGLAVSIQSHEVCIPEGPIRLELEQFEYEQRGANVYYAAPDGMHDDCVMALALAIQHKKSRANAPRVFAGWA